MLTPEPVLTPERVLDPKLLLEPGRGLGVRRVATPPKVGVPRDAVPNVLSRVGALCLRVTLGWRLCFETVRRRD